MNAEHNKHDRFIKAVFSNVEKAREYFEDNLPADLLKQIDLNSIKLTNKSFITKGLQEYFADLVFDVKLKSGNSAYACILFEHKSKIDKFVTVQQGHYIFSYLMEQIKSGTKHLNPIIPVLFYHGRKKWNYHTLRSLFEGVDESILKYVPDYEYVFHNLQAMSDHELLQSNAKFWNGISLMLKHAHDEEYLIKQAGVIFSRFENERGNLLSPVLVYFISLIKNKTNMMKAIDIMPEPIQGKARNAYEELILEGMEKGTEKTALNLYKLGATLEYISKATELSIEELERIIQDAQS